MVSNHNYIENKALSVWNWELCEWILPNGPKHTSVVALARKWHACKGQVHQKSMQQMMNGWSFVWVEETNTDYDKGGDYPT